MNPHEHEHDEESWIERVRGSQPPLDAVEAQLLPALRAAIVADAQQREAAQREAAQREAGLQRLLARLQANGLIEPEADETQRWIDVVQGRRAAADAIEAALAPALRQAIGEAAATRGEAALLARLERAGLLAVDPAEVAEAAQTPNAVGQMPNEAAAGIAASAALPAAQRNETPGSVPASAPAHTPPAAAAAQRVAESLRRRPAANWPWFAAAATLVAVLALALYPWPQAGVYPPGNEILRGGIEDIAMLHDADPATRAAQFQRELRALGFAVRIVDDGAVRILDVAVPERGRAAYQVWLQRSVSPAAQVVEAGNYRVVVQPENGP